MRDGAVVLISPGELVDARDSRLEAGVIGIGPGEPVAVLVELVIERSQRFHGRGRLSASRRCRGSHRSRSCKACTFGPGSLGLPGWLVGTGIRDRGFLQLL